MYLSASLCLHGGHHNVHTGDQCKEQIHKIANYNTQETLMNNNKNGNEYDKSLLTCKIYVKIYLINVMSNYI